MPSVQEAAMSDASNGAASAGDAGAGSDLSSATAEQAEPPSGFVSLAARCPAPAPPAPHPASQPASPFSPVLSGYFTLSHNMTQKTEEMPRPPSPLSAALHALSVELRPGVEGVTPASACSSSVSAASSVDPSPPASAASDPSPTRSPPSTTPSESPTTRRPPIHVASISLCALPEPSPEPPQQPQAQPPQQQQQQQQQQKSIYDASTPVTPATPILQHLALAALPVSSSALAAGPSSTAQAAPSASIMGAAMTPQTHRTRSAQRASPQLPPLPPPSLGMPSLRRSVSAHEHTLSSRCGAQPGTCLQQQQQQQQQQWPSSALLHREGRGLSLLSSLDPRLRFVSSYPAAVSQCMRQDELAQARRNPRLVGRILAHVMMRTTSKHWGKMAATLAVLIAIEQAERRHWLAWVPLLFVVLLVAQLLRMRSRLGCELQPNVPLPALACFKHPRLLARARALPVARLYAATQGGLGLHHLAPHAPASPAAPSGATGAATAAGMPSPGGRESDILFQPAEGYCGHATLNNVLGSIPMPYHAAAQQQAGSASPKQHASGSSGGSTRRFFVSMPALLRPFSLRSMHHYFLRLLRASHALHAAVERVDAIHDWSEEAKMQQTTTAEEQATTQNEQQQQQQQPPQQDSAAAALKSALPAAASPDVAARYAAFLRSMQTQVNDPRYRFMANFLRTPLFFCSEELSAAPTAAAVVASGAAPTSTPSTPKLAPAATKGEQGAGSGAIIPISPSVAVPASASVSSSSISLSSSLLGGGSGSNVPLSRKLFSGHWSPIVAWLEPADAERVLFRNSSSAGTGTPSAPCTPLRSASGALGAPLAGLPPLCLADSGLPPTPPAMSASALPCSPAGGAVSLHYAHYLSATAHSSGPSGAAAQSLQPHASERALLQDGLLLIADVNPSYGFFLVPPRRLFDALCTVNVLDGGPRGILRVTLRGAATSATAAQGTATPPSAPSTPTLAAVATR